MGSTKKPVIYFCFSFLIRGLLLVASLICVYSMLTTSLSKEWEGDTTFYGTFLSNFTASPSFIYFVVVFSVVGIYTIIIKLSSCLVICLAPASPTMLLIFAFFDVLILGLVASATGSIAFFAQNLQMGDDNFSWSEFCYDYNSFCNRLGLSIGVSIFATILLILLLWTSLLSFYKRIHKQGAPRTTVNTDIIEQAL